MKTFEEGMKIELLDYDTGRIDTFTIQSRNGSRATLIGVKGKSFIARIRAVRQPTGECLDVSGYNCIFSYDILPAREIAKSSMERAKPKLPPSPKPVLNGRSPLESMPIKRIKDALTMHKSAKAAAESLGCSIIGLVKFAKRHGLTVPNGNPRKLTAVHIHQIMAMLASGISISQVGVKLNVADSTIHRFARDHDLVKFAAKTRRTATPTALEGRQEEVQALLDQRITFKQIGEMHGVSAAQVQRLVKKYKLKVSNHRAVRKLTDAQEQQVVSMRRRGELIKTICERFGICASTVCRIMKQRNETDNN